MQVLDNVVVFKKLTKEVGHIEAISSVVGAGTQPSHKHRESTKGVLEMSRHQQALKVLRTTKKAAIKPRKESNPPDTNTAISARNEKFRILARRRVPKALHSLELIENLASHNYKYTQEQADKIIRALEDAVEKVREAFNKPKRIERVHSFEI